MGGGLQNGRGLVMFYPTKREGGGVLAMPKGGGTSFGVDFMRKLKVLAILKGGGCKKFPLFKRGGRNKFTLS